MNQLEKLITDYKGIQLAKKHLEDLNEKLESERKRLFRLSAILEKEQKDVKDYFKISIKSLFNKFLEDPSHQYEIEKQEYLIAVLNFKEAKKLFDLLEYEKGLLEKKLENEERIQKLMNQEIAENGDKVADSFPHLKEDFIHVSNQIDLMIGFRTELNEALTVSDKIVEVFDQMISVLKKAKMYENWGVFYREIQEGKQKKAAFMDQSHDLSVIAKKLLQKLEVEMIDIFNYIKMHRIIHFDDLRHFNDIYYERLLSDWILKQNLDSSINFIIGTKDSILRIHGTLKTQIAKTTTELNHLLEEQKKMLLDKF